MTIDPIPCKYCKRLPKVVNIGGDLFYAQCQCGKWGPYDFCGATKLRTIENWNTYNKPFQKGNKDDRDILL